MNIPLRRLRIVVTFLIALTFVLQETSSVLAGTTGAISGIVVDATTKKPIAGARVTAVSPSQTASTTTDAGGHYGLLSLAPDTYTLSVAPTDANDAVSLSGITVQADQTLNQTLTQPEKLKTIGKVTSRAASSLVKPGTTADVYSINAAQQDKASQVGGGGTLNSAWSALSTVPGVFVAPNQTGYIGAGASLSIRGGDYDQIGYELDGIPVNRSFDNYPSASLPSLGQQEVQVYTGAAPPGSSTEGISGYVNQVIKTGSAPGYEQFSVADGSPAFYHKFTVEAGGANADHTFSYYVGLGGYNQSYRYGDQFNGASVANLYGFPVGSCSAVTAAAFNPTSVPSCFTANGTPYNTSTPSYVLGGVDLNQQATASQRDSVVNLHFGIPYKNGSRDDVQLLLDINTLGNSYYSSPNDLGGPAYLNAIGSGVPTYDDGYQVQTPYGTLLTPTATGGGAVVDPYLFPGVPASRAQGLGTTPIGNDIRDNFVNDQNIFKAQYQHNIGSSAYVRVYGYTYYSDWLYDGPNTTESEFLSVAPSDYELSSHARGVSIQGADQINNQNLVTLSGSYTTASVIRYNNSGLGQGPDTVAGYLVDGNNPYNGVAYTAAGVPVPGAIYNTAGTPFQELTIGQILTGTAVVPKAGVTCGGGPCEYEIVGGGQSATYNSVVPKFYNASLTDDFRPTSKLDVNVGIRYDLFSFFGANTYNSGARTFFYNAYNSQNPTAPLEFNPTGAGNVDSYPVFEPRLGLTYSVAPTTVVRASYGRYAQAPNTASEQYNYLQPNSLDEYINFGQFGLPTTPGHSIVPPVSNNFDFSIEHQFAGDTAFKVSPFLRKTQNQIQNFFLDQKTGFVSGLNVGNQTSQGVEFELDKGNFARDGFAGKLSFTYTNSYIRYNREPDGESIIDPINAAIAQYNSYTKAGGGFPYYSLANATTGAPGVGSTTGGPGYVANPYYNAPIQGLLDPNGNYPTFDTFPGGITSTASTYGAPYFATLLAQYKHGPLTITPAVQFNAGQRYGIPENTPGIEPDQILATLPGSAAGDPRYPYGSPGAGGAPYSNFGYDVGGFGYAAGSNCAAATGCTQTVIPIPDPATGKFDGLGQFVQPSFLQLNTQIAYDISKRVTLVATLTNLYTNYFGGSKEPWTVKGGQVYDIQAAAAGTVYPTGNVYNPGGPLQPFTQSTYIPTYLGLPFGVFVEARVKI